MEYTEYETLMNYTYVPNGFYRVSVKGLVTDQSGAVLLIQERVGEHENQWELPGGNVKFGETIESALKREMREELGVGVTRIGSRPLYVWLVKRKRFHALFLVYEMKLSSYRFTFTSDECVHAAFFSKRQMATLNTHENIKQFVKLYRPSGARKPSLT